MAVTLCMVVENEASHLAECLRSVLPFVDQVLIADTGSSDGTQEIIRSVAQIEPILLSLDPQNCFSLTPARNKLYSNVKTDWILYLDADERLAWGAGSTLNRVLSSAPANIGGYFGQWQTFLAGEPDFEDYKLFVFRSQYRKRGLAHGNVQLDIRLKGGTAAWMDGLRVDHHPSTAGLPIKRDLYWRRLQQSIILEPGWLRNNWFAGYMCFQDRRFAEAHRLFEPLIASRSPVFPVEGLNARMVSVDMHIREGNLVKAQEALLEAEEFVTVAGEDFEVKVNTRIRPWLSEAFRQLTGDEVEMVRAYRFAA